MHKYIPRVVDKELNNRLKSKGAILITGPKWCGKTTTGKNIAESVIEVDNPEKYDYYMQIAELNPTKLLEGQVPHMIDEWQLAPKLWNAVRYEVDKRDEFGQFILTGSAVPAKLDESMHTGTGRIGRIKMRPMSLFESMESSGEVSLTDLFEKKDISGTDNHTLDDISFFICRGGWPRAVREKNDIALRQAIDYFDGVVSDDISRANESKKSEDRARRLMRSYARNVASQATIETIRRDILSNETDTFSPDSMYEYLDALKKIFVIEDAPAWNPNLRSKSAIRTTDTRYYVDPSIATAALGIGPDDLLNDLDTMGLLFENLCIRDLRVYSESLEGKVYHYRDKSDLECDAVVHLRDGSYGLVEIKLGGDRLVEEGANNLIKLEKKIDTSKMNEPAFKMVLCGVAPYAYTRKDGVAVVPISCLRD